MLRARTLMILVAVLGATAACCSDGPPDADIGPPPGPPLTAAEAAARLPTDPACARRLETLHERVVEIHVDEDGGRRLGLERSARWHRIDPVRSPDSEALIAFAEAARDAGTRIYITVDVTDAPRTKRPPQAGEPDGEPPIVIRLADTAD